MLQGARRQMNQKDFEGVIAARLEKIRSILLAKNAEYAPGADKLANFKSGGQLLRCTPERALVGYLAKHLVSVLDKVDDLNCGLLAGEAIWDEKIGDSINYLILLECLISERLEKSK